jgi:hypothetical protein
MVMSLDSKFIGVVAAVVLFVVMGLAIRSSYTVVLVLSCCVASLGFAGYLAQWVLAKDEGSADMTEVGGGTS